MLTVTADQLALLGERRLAEFLPRACEFLRANLPQKFSGMPEEELRSRVRRMVERARQFGLSAEYDLIAYCDLSLRFDSPLENVFPWAGEVLRDDAMPAERKMPVLVEAIATRAVLEGKR